MILSIALLLVDVLSTGCKLVISSIFRLNKSILACFSEFILACFSCCCGSLLSETSVYFLLYSIESAAKFKIFVNTLILIILSLYLKIGL